MNRVKGVCLLVAGWLLTAVLPIGAAILYGVYVLTGCRSGRVLKAANLLADTFFMLMVLYILSDYYKLTDKGDKWLKE